MIQRLLGTHNHKERQTKGIGNLQSIIGNGQPVTYQQDSADSGNKDGIKIGIIIYPDHWYIQDQVAQGTAANRRNTGQHDHAKAIHMIAPGR